MDDDLAVVSGADSDVVPSEISWEKPIKEISIPHNNKQYFIFTIVGERANISKLNTYKQVMPDKLSSGIILMSFQKILFLIGHKTHRN